MFVSFFSGPRISRPSEPRHASRAFRPTSEPMEGRCLLSTTPLMTISNERMVEPDTGTAPMEFTVQMTTPTSRVVTVDYQTIDRTATAGVDYVAQSGRLTFAPGQVEQTITIDILSGSGADEIETFFVTLSNPQNARVIKAIGVGTIVDNTPVAPEMTINNVSMTRGFSGTKEMTFTISLNTALDTPVSVTASTRNVTAIAGVDYTAKTETLTFEPGETTKEFTVLIHGTSNLVPNLLFYVDLTSSDVPLKVSTGVGVIRYGA
jgi:hypothetical protein